MAEAYPGSEPAFESFDPFDLSLPREDAADLALCRAVVASSGPGLPHDQFLALLAAEDARVR